MVSKFIKFLGSIQLAVPVLSVIASILIWATLYESKVGSLMVQQQIYKSPWFGALMFLLAVNLGVSTLSRYPWRGARKIGFALTHLGLIVLIAGSAAVIHLGTEGLLLVRTDQPANHLVRVEGELLEVMDNQSQVQQTTVIVKPDRVISPTRFAGLSLLNYRENTLETPDYHEGSNQPNPAIRLALRSDRINETFDQWLSLNPQSAQTIALGPAQLELRQAVDETTLQQLLANPEKSQMGQAGQLQIDLGDAHSTLAIDSLRRQDAVLENDVQVHLTEVWPDFRLDDLNQPMTVSQEWQNPAVQVDITQADQKERWFVFAQAGFEPMRSVLTGESTLDLQLRYQVPPPPAADYFRVVVANQQLYYAARSSAQFSAGPLDLGQTVRSGWADFQITLTDWLTHAQIDQKRLPAPPGVDSGVPALLVATEAGQQQWIPWGESAVITQGSDSAIAAFGPRMMALPFGIGLDDFVVERNEGSESVAMWTSRIRLQDLHGEDIQQRSVWMNHPTWYQGWKIAQASWNPGDLNQSTLQIKREPRWVTVLTWSGALLTVSGIGVMFYGPTLFKKKLPLFSQPDPPTETLPEPTFIAEPTPVSLTVQDGL